MTLAYIAERYLQPDPSPVGWLWKSGVVCAVLCAAAFAAMGRSIGLLIAGLVLGMLSFCALLVALIFVIMRSSTASSRRQDRAALLAGPLVDFKLTDRRVTINGVTVGQGAYFVVQTSTGRTVELWINDGGDVNLIAEVLTANMRQRVS